MALSRAELQARVAATTLRIQEVEAATAAVKAVVEALPDGEVLRRVGVRGARWRAFSRTIFSMVAAALVLFIYRHAASPHVGHYGAQDVEELAVEVDTQSERVRALSANRLAYVRHLKRDGGYPPILSTELLRVAYPGLRPIPELGGLRESDDPAARWANIGVAACTVKIEELADHARRILLWIANPKDETGALILGADAERHRDPRTMRLHATMMEACTDILTPFSSTQQ